MNIGKFTKQYQNYFYWIKAFSGLNVTETEFYGLCKESNAVVRKAGKILKKCLHIKSST